MAAASIAAISLELPGLAVNDSGYEEPPPVPADVATDVEVECRPAPAAPGAADFHDEAFSTNRTYEPSDKHAAKGRVVAGRTVQKAPTNGQAALDGSVIFSEHTSRRVGVDSETGEFVVFDRTGNKVVNKKVVGGVYHGHVRTWDELEPEMQNALEQEGFVDSRGRITLDAKKADATP